MCEIIPKLSQVSERIELFNFIRAARPRYEPIVNLTDDTNRRPDDGAIQCNLFEVQPTIISRSKLLDIGHLGIQPSEFYSRIGSISTHTQIHSGRPLRGISINIEIALSAKNELQLNPAHSIHPRLVAMECRG